MVESATSTTTATVQRSMWATGATPRLRRRTILVKTSTVFMEATAPLILSTGEPTAIVNQCTEAVDVRSPFHQSANLVMKEFLMMIDVTVQKVMEDSDVNILSRMLNLMMTSVRRKLMSTVLITKLSTP